MSKKVSDMFKDFEEKSTNSLKESVENKRPTLKTSKKLIIPEHIKDLFNDLDKSISSIWGMQKDGKIKWVAKYKLWTIYKKWFEEL